MSEVIEGRNPVTEALRSGRPINKILLAENVGQSRAIAEIRQLSRARGIPFEVVTRQALDQASTSAAHQGVIAYAAAHEYTDLSDILAISRQKREPPFICLLDGVEDPQNFGSILRTAEAAGVHGVVIRARRAVGLTAAVARASAGAIEYISVARVTNISQTIEMLKTENVWVTGVDMTGKTDYTSVDYRPATAIVIGGEGTGLSELVRKRCDNLVAIPMRGQVSSLNASVAAALVMYEVMRQRPRQVV